MDSERPATVNETFEVADWLRIKASYIFIILLMAVSNVTE